MRTVASVLPFRVNRYVLDELIDWDRVPTDPIFQLVFPQRGMLPDEAFERMRGLVTSGAAKDVIQAAAREIQFELNPHPADQMDLNVPRWKGESLAGCQHKYRETLLYFPSQGQTCHSYCTYCFRWAQFVGLDEMKFASREIEQLVGYLHDHEEITDVLFTGGDPLVMRTKVLRRYVEPLLEIPHLRSIRIGSKAPAYWPQRFVTDSDADDLLRLFEEVVTSGRNLALMAHLSHPVELSTEVARTALRRVVATGATMRSQAPLIRHVNDDPSAWSTLWNDFVQLGGVPYYMFVERDTGAKRYFEVPLARALEIFSAAYGEVSGLARTVRGPSMSASPGKVLVDGVAEIRGEKVFLLKFLQGRDATWSNRVFHARFDPHATWLDELKPAFGEKEFFFEEPMRAALGKARGIKLAV